MSFLADIFKGGAEGVFTGVAAIITKVKADPTKVVELEYALEQAKLDLTAKLAQADAAAIASVNASMQAEAKSEHWMQFSWRPTVGFTFAGLLINNYILLAYLKPYGIVPLDIPDGIWNAMLIVLGVSAGTRGWEKVSKVK